MDTADPRTDSLARLTSPLRDVRRIPLARLAAPDTDDASGQFNSTI